MNKILKIAFCTVLSLICLLCFCACGDKDKANTNEESSTIKQYITGRYELESIEWAGGTVASGSILQDSEDTMGDMYVELYSDGTAQLSLYGRISDMEFSEDKMKEIDSELNTYDFTVGGGKVILKKSGDTYIFVKR